ncbi:MAG: RNA 2',3'-cyclic phosphodiesterase [Saprospiraceae bacterium]|nr:RNA 2',3'-cyclic phosphodiesterase [Saprospiraceae bacterium]
MRLFTAINIIPSEKLLKILELLEKNLKHDKIRWVKPDNIHITLKFFGEINENKLPEIIDIQTKVFYNHSPLNINIENIGVFGSSYNPKVIWFGLNPSEQLKLLVNELEISLNSIGFEADRQNFVPHLTIGRISSIQNNSFFQKVISKYKNEFIQNVAVDKICLFESVLTSKGAIHSIVSEFKLK